MESSIRHLMRIVLRFVLIYNSLGQEPSVDPDKSLFVIEIKNCRKV